ncbi:MAG: hypothetical protein A3B74_00420 [Candidatus Kerfeldbacteria bacterium RIFCSPHIGHO2_02_FULL_42_14]|uniref:2TM domain-containing protein n=1 Tax=Candidatus Kerfeldbacteria bacterium RIFCSPHIGHO2_02_FULL_42_14 TaxID=1798540 RepID=A0A1G2AS02_9BACT|nr:MAG: hypothetical protein A3B74_00420 [Candidatus Kerfeldbacteria bacterium RIFCSPHIGHO2_02_FULL_42_14]OGY81264.1 MAG: hypothetical protein A3E60_02320 [Candidatus Kerfeldbacteria bacterium RIFCSPHIGHO2_12_FULL_42_13]OGY83539.1 MAG: hypothetical protein A3I91_02755 [Candidatus Kerfeldbacteria bacterium RIFCSPLOWO2_02_FULL_42_19]OGY85782.1 MAG: hypothetical protein A3G01_03975 [Candidatus Kerfeldbacteria bacterium RIFCSPLOWO2_12_FULL_43_9]
MTYFKKHTYQSRFRKNVSALMKNVSLLLLSLFTLFFLIDTLWSGFVTNFLTLTPLLIISLIVHFVGIVLTPKTQRL